MGEIMNNLKELSELAWQGEVDTKFEHHPVHTFYEGSTELAENLLGLKGIGGFYVVDTNDGLVMIDAGSHLDIDSSYEEINKWRPQSNVKAAVLLTIMWIIYLRLKNLMKMPINLIKKDR